MFADAVGDNDPIDAIEIGTQGSALPMGSIVPCKVLGSLALIDEGETDHKIIVIREDDPNFHHIHSVRDMDKFVKGATARLVHWLKYYKTSDGKGVNELGNDDLPIGASEASDLIEEVVGFYEDLLDGTTRVSDNFYLGPSNVRASSSRSYSSSSSTKKKKNFDPNEPATDDETY